MAEKKSKPSIEEIIAHRRNCLDTEESDREALTEYIRQFVDAARGNQIRLARESGIPQSKISNMLNGTGTSAGMETLVILALTIKNIS
ncbi:transcriptional regulator [Leptospira interrogans]|uniref:transcriptional regulator n=1 Tax=Leptospira interrogans TaxID=173 RepID=UPI0009E2851D|nr:transcriptional regulator [Leptospira interrogans]